MAIEIINASMLDRNAAVSRWQRAVWVGEAWLNKRSWPNAEATANGIAALAQIDGSGLYVKATRQDIADKVDIGRWQVKRGIDTLKEEGYLSVVHEATGRGNANVYALTVPAESEWRINWTKPRVRRASIELSQQQQELALRLQEFVGRPVTGLGNEVFVLQGWAGSGKTAATIEILGNLLPEDQVLYVAPSNQAASILRSRGVSASTIHREFYVFLGVDQEGDPVFKEDLHNSVGGKELVVVDEASMVNEATARWIEDSSRRVLAIGDSQQLSPARGSSYWTAPDREPDFVLTEVHRQSNPAIADLCRTLRTEGWTPGLLRDSPLRAQGPVDASKYETILLWTHREREALLEVLRDGADTVPQRGDEVIILASTAQQEDGPDDYYSSQVLHVVENLRTVVVDGDLTVPRAPDGRTVRSEWRYHVLKVRDLHDRLRIVRVFGLGFNGHAWERAVRPLRRQHEGHVIHSAAFGRALTVHRAQGSQYRSLLLIDSSERQAVQGGVTNASRWLYTACSRAVEELAIADITQVLPQAQK